MNDFDIKSEYYESIKGDSRFNGLIPTAFKSFLNGSATLVNSSKLSKLTTASQGVKNIPEITGDKLNTDAKANAKDQEKQKQLLALLDPPDDRYTTTLTSSEQALVNTLDESVNLHLIKQFYESYFSPTGLNDAFNRLGTVDSTITNVHDLIPDGANAVMGSDSNATWRTNINYAFEVDSGLPGAKPIIYTNYAYGPMAPRNPSAPFSEKSSVDYNYDAHILEKKDDEGNVIEGQTFDLDNLTYNGNQATLRRPGFKSINDNINLVQYLMNRAFGIESTYINEWDLSIYMQEGIVDSKSTTDVNHPGSVVMAPVFVTTLTFGLLNDTPIAENLEGNFSKNLDSDMLTRAVTYGSFNMAVSNRLGIDSLATSKGCNKYVYSISSYPQSKYWIAPNDGENLNYVATGNAAMPYSDMNVSYYWDDLLAIRQCGEVYGETSTKSAEAEAGFPKYTPSHIFGTDLYGAKAPLEFVIKHSDAREAVLSGWNSTNDAGELMNKNDDTNLCKNSNSYAYLPFWKQFFYNPGDGMEDLDQYWQSLNGDGQDKHSILTCADEILEIITADNEPFNSFRKAKQAGAKEKGYSDSNPTKNNAFKLDQDGGGGRGDLEVSLPVIGSVTIPKTKLLNMFLHKDEDADKAKAKGDKKKDNFLSNGMANPGGSGSDSVTSKKTEASYEVDPETGDVTFVDAEDSLQDTDEAIGKKLSYADGVNNFSPFLYGGPHGAYNSPNTLEGYVQPNNQLTKTVPTMDIAPIYHGKSISTPGNRSYTNSKNFKKGSFLNTRVCLSLVERSNLLGLRRKIPIPKMTVTFNSGYTWYYVGHSRAAWDFEICIRFWRWKKCWGFSIPKQIVALSYNNWEGYRWPWAWQYWDTRSAYQRVYTTTQVSMDVIMRDFKMPINITPVPWYWTPNHSQGSDITGWVGAQTADLDTVLKPWQANGNVKFLVYPATRYDPDYFQGRIYNPGGYADSCDWKNFLHNVYVFSKYGREKVPMSLPITDPRTGEIISTIVTPVQIISTRTQVPAWRWVWDYYWSFRWWWGRYHHCGWWWCHHRWGWLGGRQRIWYLRLERYLRENVNVYNLLIDPRDITNIIPSRKVVEEFIDYQSINDSGRDKTSSDIIERWKLSANLADYGRGVASFYPFSNEFFNRYGLQYYRQMGISSYSDRNIANKTLRASAIAFGDVTENYVNNDGKIFLRTATGYRYIYTNKDYTWHDHWKAAQYGWYIVDIHTHHQWSTQNLTLQSDYMLATSTGKEEHSEWARFFDEIPNTPAVAYSEIAEPTYRQFGWRDAVDSSKQRFYVFDPLEVYDVFAETCITQIKWLEQLKDFVERYTSDPMIYNTYKLVTDPNIINVTQLANENSVDNETYYTGSYTEDINYFSALAILEEKYSYTKDSNYNDVTGLGSMSLSNSSAPNSLKDLIANRISDIQKLYIQCNKLKQDAIAAVSNSNQCAAWDAAERFSVFVTDVYGLLNCEKGAKGWMFKDGKTTYTSHSVMDSCMTVAGERKYNLVENPAALLWAYANVLYQARKFYVNKRLDKVQGSYWIMRALERVLTFQAARGEAIKQDEIVPAEVSSESPNNLNKAIAFIEAKDSQEDLSQRKPTDLSPVYTKAVYIPVSYIADSHFKDSVKFDATANTYNNQEYTYVEQVYKYAYKPKNGYYYIMSKEIKDQINQMYASYSEKKAKLKDGSYPVTVEELDLINDKITQGEFENLIRGASNADEYMDEIGNISEEKTAYLRNLYVDKTLKEAISYDTLKKTTKNANNEDVVTDTGVIDLTTLDDTLNVMRNRLLDHYFTDCEEFINRLLYKVYIDWNTTEEGTGSAIDEGDLKYYFDKYQYSRTKGKLRKVTDQEGIEHSSEDAIKSGITFSVADGANIGTLLTNYDKIGSFSAKELACSLVGKKDYWRIEVPDDYKIPTDILATKPVLVSDYAISLLRDSTQGVVISPESVVAAVNHRIAVPIKHHDASMITASTAAALGEVVSIHSLGIDGLTAEGSEVSFG